MESAFPFCPLTYFTDPLAFRPNPAALMSSANNGGDLSGSEEDNDFNDDDLAPQGTGRDRGSAAGRSSDGIYRPPRLAPVAYNEPGKGGYSLVPLSLFYFFYSLAYRKRTDCLL